MKKRWDLAALASIPLIMTLANSMLIPVLPLLQKKLHISAVQSSLIITVYAAISIVFIPIAGYLSDRYGRKIIIIIGLSIAALGGLIAGLAAWLMDSHVYAVILAGRFIQGIGAAGAFPIVIPLVGDMFDKEEEVSSGLGMIETSNTFGKVLSPVLGAALALIVWFLPLAIIPILSIIAIVAVLFLVKVPNKKRSEAVGLKTFWKSIKAVFGENGHWLYAIFAIGCIGMLIMFGFLYNLSSVIEESYHIEGIIKGLLLAIPLSAICLASFITGKYVGENKNKMKWLIVIGTALLAIMMLLCGLINKQGLFFLVLFMFASGAGIGLFLPSLDALITEGIEKKQRGTITSLYSSARFIGVAAGPLLASLLLGNKEIMFYLFTGLALLCTGLALFAIKPDKEQTSS
ncbi:ACDE family multidrug resistance protein [Paenibacillus endophyticus]|uniref:ACDE family multidrug resistance protein n=1 Tax=Paenibacillus endophyticus TaxID=1294268 RepID=A0A7W5GAB7_9BACL|nr:MFS transporter [Paenibacillus endophyticus]MBB3152168.1 ACDE family multidrug resistance protein [Paenibacillus endophyticus]